MGIHSIHMARHNPPNNPGQLWGGLTPIPAARKYPEWNEEGCRELFMSLDSREEVEPLFKDKEGDYKARCPSMQEFIETTLKMPYLGEWEFERQDNMQAYTLNLENRVQLAILMDGAPQNYKG